jgi:hypothetical protein
MAWFRYSKINSFMTPTVKVTTARLKVEQAGGGDGV